QDRQADLVTGNLGRARGAHGVFHLLGQQIQRILVHIAPLAGAADALDDLLAAERLGDTAALDDGEHRGFYRSETPPTLGAGPAAPNGLAFIGFPRVDHPGVGMTAERTVHDRSFAVLTSRRTLRAYLCAPPRGQYGHDMDAPNVEGTERPWRRAVFA